MTDGHLFRVMIKVRPLREHPEFWNAQFGWLLIWVVAKDRKEAAERAGSGLAWTKCEPASENALAVREDQYPSTGDRFEPCKRAALIGQGNFYVLWRPIGSDEQEEKFDIDDVFVELPGLPMPCATDPPSS